MAEFDVFNLENKLRTMIQELIAPTIRRTIEAHETLERLAKSDRENADRIQSLEFTATRLTNKLPLLDELYKSIQELNSGHHTTEAVINLKTESIMAQIEVTQQSCQNLSTLIKMNEDSITMLKQEILEHTESMTGLKEHLVYENGVLSKKLEKTRSEAKEIWDLINERIRKLSLKIDEFNQVAIPSVLSEVEMVKRKLEFEFSEVKNEISNFITFEEFDKFGRSLKFENDKAFQNFKLLSDHSQKMEEYLDYYMPIASWGMISEALSCLDPKLLSGYIEVDRQKFETLKTRIEEEHLDIDNLVVKAMNVFEEGQKRRDSLKVNIESAAKKERKPKKVARAKSPVREQKRREKPEEKPGKEPEEKEPELISISIKNNFLPTRRMSNNKIVEVSYENSHSSLNKKESEEEFGGIRQDTPRSPTCPPNREPGNEELTPSQQSFLAREPSQRSARRRERTSILDPDKVTSNLYIPVASRPSSSVSDQRRRSHSELSYVSNANSESSAPDIDPVKLEKDLSSLKSEISRLESTSKDLSNTVSQNTETLNTSLSRFSQDMSSNFSLIHHEVKQLIQKNKQSRVDVSKSLSDFSNELKEREKNVDRVDKQFSNVSELLANIVEFCRVVHSLLSQEEEDRENLSLIGLSESKQSPKSYLSLRPECISCSGNNTIITSAFKMACINYNPSPIKYCLKTFSRKQLIHLIGTFINESWRAATARPPYDRVAPPTMSNISLTSDPARRRNRYSRSQYLELPSLNTSKQYLEPNETSIHSFKEYKQ